MSHPCRLCARANRQRQVVQHTDMDEKERLMDILRRLIETTRDHHLAMPLAGEVNAIKIVLRHAREEGGLDFVLATIRVLEIPIEV